MMSPETPPPSRQDTRVVRAQCTRWIEPDGYPGSVEDGFVEVENVQDGTVSLTICDDDVDEVERTWLKPAKARRIAHALIAAADEIEDEQDEPR